MTVATMMPTYLSPMMAKPGGDLMARQAHAGNTWWLEAKLDGWRYIVHKDDRGELHCYGGRNGAEYTGQLPYLEAQLAAMLPDGTAIDGELIGNEWGDVQGVMTRTVTPQGAPLRYVVFDLLRLSLRDVRPFPIEARTEALTVLEWDDYPELEMSEQHDASKAKHDELVAAGFEGTVWKRKGSLYTPTRSSSWLKFKHEQSNEAIATGFKPGEGEFAGMVGAIEFDLYDEYGKLRSSSRASGMDLDTRRDMTDNPSAWIGSVIEVKHNGFMTSGKPRHPRFMRRRDDRTAQDVMTGSPNTPATPAPTPRSVTRRGAAPTTVQHGSFAGASKRNYGAMSADKLLRSIRELEGGYGEAHEKALMSGGNPDADLAKAQDIARSKGWL